MRSGKFQAWAWRRAALTLAVLAAIFALRAGAHEIPTDVKIDAFFRPSGDRLELRRNCGAFA